MLEHLLWYEIIPIWHRISGSVHSTGLLGLLILGTLNQKRQITVQFYWGRNAESAPVKSSKTVLKTLETITYDCVGYQGSQNTEVTRKQAFYLGMVLLR